MITNDNNDILGKLSEIEGIIEYKPVELSSGKISDYYVDIKRSYGEPRILHMYANYITSQLGFELQNTSCIIGSGYGGVPLATTLFSRLGMWDIKLSMFRDNPKEHGRPSMFDGYPLEKLSRRKKVVIVDDVLTTGRSIRKILEALPEDLMVGRI
ncbi:hypothetical protein GQ568_00920 [Patescibacteria group bacterium]|nr:hypothetical protein [Patescibacteria group bacterium]